MAINISDSFHAAALVLYTVPGTPNYGSQSGFKGAPIDTAPGDMLLDFDDQSKIDPLASIITATPVGDPGIVTVTPISDDQVRVRTYDLLGAPLDNLAFSLTVHRHKL